MHDVTVLNNIFLALYTHLAGFANGGFASVMDVVVVLDNLGTDETLFKVGVDDTCALGCLPSAAEGPCLYLHLACGDECLKGEKAVYGLDKAVTSALAQSHVFKEHMIFVVGLKLGNVGIGM